MLRHHFYLARTLFANGALSQLKGDWSAARDFSDRGLATSPRDPRLLLTRILLEYQVGDFDQGEVYMERLLEVMRLGTPGPTLEYIYPALVIPQVARITGITDRFEFAEAAAETVLSSPSVAPLMIVAGRYGLALMAVKRRDVAAATEQYTALETATDAPYSVLIGFEFNRLLGLLAQTMGNPDKAIEHFEEALAFCRNAGYRPELAWSLCDYADCLMARNHSGDREKP